jgi:hypothetical protein
VTFRFHRLILTSLNQSFPLFDRTKCVAVVKLCSTRVVNLYEFRMLSYLDEFINAVFNSVSSFGDTLTRLQKIGPTTSKFLEVIGLVAILCKTYLGYVRSFRAV